MSTYSVITTRGGMSRRLQQLERRGPQDGAQRRVDAAHRPVVGQRLVDGRVDLELALDHAGDDLAEEVGIGGQVFLALDLAAQHVMRAELAQRVLERLAADIHLVERLHGGQPRGTALVGGAWRRLGSRGLGSAISAQKVVIFVRTGARNVQHLRHYRAEAEEPQVSIVLDRVSAARRRPSSVRNERKSSAAEKFL